MGKYVHFFTRVCQFWVGVMGVVVGCNLYWHCLSLIDKEGWRSSSQNFFLIFYLSIFEAIQPDPSERGSPYTLFYKKPRHSNSLIVSNNISQSSPQIFLWVSWFFLIIYNVRNIIHAATRDSAVSSLKSPDYLDYLDYSFFKLLNTFLF